MRRTFSLVPVLAVLVLSAPVDAQSVSAAGRALQLEDYYQLKRVG